MYKIFGRKEPLISSLKLLNTEEITYFQTEIQLPQGLPTVSSIKGRKRKNLPSHLLPRAALYRVH